MAGLAGSFEERTMKKVMYRLIPFLWILYIIAYIDRVNISYAALEMNADLAITAEMYGILSGTFFIAYFLFEVPSNLLMQRYGARIWLARIMITWGLVVVITGFAQSVWQLYILRFLLGAAEAGFFPGVMYYLTYWFRNQELGRAYSWFLISLPAATLIGAPVSTWIIDHIHWFNLAGWRWMFILEGLLAVVFGLICLAYLKNRPQDARWLTDEEKNWLEGELEKERQEKYALKGTSRWQALKNSNTWKISVFYFIVFASMYGLGFWLPTIVQGFSDDLSNTTIGLISMLPSILVIPFIILWGQHSDKTGERKYHIIISIWLAACGFLGAGLSTSPVLAMIFITLASMGLYGIGGPLWSFLHSFYNQSASAVGIALVNSLASLGGFFGPMVFGFFDYKSGMFFLCFMLIVSTLPVFTIKENAKEKPENVHI